MSPDNMNTSDFSGGASGAGLGWDAEDTFWKGNYSTRPYASKDRSYDFYRPAYQYGFQSASTTHKGRQWNEVESDLERGWDRAKGTSKGMWADVKHAVRDAWDRVTGHTDRGAKKEIGREINKGTY